MATAPSFTDWLDARTGYRAGLRHLLAEPIPAGVNWWFTLGSVLLFLLLLQLVTGAVLTMYYVPTPAYAYDSVRYFTSGVLFGRLLRGLHFFGASFIVVFAVLHLLRVLLFGAYKRPREVTWWSGIALLAVILAFALTGYLLPWDQRAYWATVVTINIAASAPIVGPWVAGVLRGGPVIGALTLSRWFAVHVILLPAALVALVVTHLYLMRRHGIAGHFRSRAAVNRDTFYPGHALKDTVVIAAVFAALVAFAALRHAPLDGMADPSDASYVPRPEWYFLGLFQLLKYFPGRLEPIASQLIPGAIVLALVLLPWLDRGPDRHPRRRGPAVGGAALVTAGVVLLTALGLRDLPAAVRHDGWGPRPIAGGDLVASARCARCHAAGGVGPDLAHARVTRDTQWIAGHLADPETIAPELRTDRPTLLQTMETRAVIAYVKQVQFGVPPPGLPPAGHVAADVFATRCIGCHAVDGDGGKAGPDLTHEGAKHDTAWLRKWITDPSAVDPDADMPAFGDKLSPEQLQAIAGWVAGKK